MDEAFDIWRSPSGKGLGRDEILNELSVPQRMAFVLGTLNYQVENGGFFQWHDNGYSVNFKETLWAIKRVGGPLADELLTMMQQLLKAIDAGDPRNQWGDLDPDEPGIYDRIEELKLDDTYYDFNESWMDNIEEYFTKVGQP
jgi:hypothetical protein